MIRSRPLWNKPEVIGNLIEKIDSKIFKQICAQCGGKGYYLHQNFDITRGIIDHSEIVNCDQCENGFRYGQKIKSGTRS